jgi:acyl-CoA synthetase (AMP-forming)/AMP-acid ligase II
MLSPHRPTLAFEEQEYTAARLAAPAGGLAGTLARRGVRPGDRVALMASNRPEWIVAVQAIWRLGAAVVLFSPAWKQAEAEHALAITQPSHAVGDHPVLADRITVEMAVAPIALALASHPKLESYDLSSLRYIMWGATPVTPSVAEIVTRRTGSAGCPPTAPANCPSSPATRWTGRGSTAPDAPCPG